MLMILLLADWTASPSPEDETDLIIRWWQQLQADTETLKCADGGRDASSNEGEARPSQRAQELNPLSVTKPDPASSLENELEQDDQAVWLDELLARARESAHRIATQETGRQASDEYATRIEREAQTQVEGERQAEVRGGAEIEM